MKILMLTGSFPPETGGIAVFMRGFADALIRSGAQVHVLAPASRRCKDRIDGLSVGGYHLPPRGYLRRVHACLRSLDVQLQTASFDRILTSSWSPFAVGLSLPGHRNRIPWDTFCHGTDLLEPSRSLRYRWLMRFTLRRADVVVANSRYTASLAGRFGATATRVHVICPGVDPSRFTPGPKDPILLSRFGVPPHASVILFVGRLIERKGVDTLLRALPEILRECPSVLHLIVGEGPDRQRLEQLTDQAGLRKAVRFVGRVSDRELPDVYRLADVFAMPNRTLHDRGDVEGFGIVFLEAAASGLPVVAGLSGGTEDAVAQGVTGVLIGSDEPALWAKQIVSLLQDGARRHRMGQAGRQRVFAEFTWDRQVSRYLRVVS